MRFDITKLPVGEMMIGFLLLALAVTFVGAFSATGGGEGGEATPSASPSAAETGTPGPTGPGGEVTFDISMGDNFFEYQGERNPTLSVPAGAQIIINLMNDGTAIHNMRFSGGDKQYNTGDDAVSDPQLVMAGQTAKLTFEAPGNAGDYPYQCDFHPTDMKGTITVQ